MAPIRVQGSAGRSQQLGDGLIAQKCPTDAVLVKNRDFLRKTGRPASHGATGLTGKIPGLSQQRMGLPRKRAGMEQLFLPALQRCAGLGKKYPAGSQKFAGGG